MSAGAQSAGPMARTWRERDRQSVFHGFSDFGTLRADGSVVLTHGDGVHVRDVNGRRYLDANSGLWNAVAGFNNARLAEAAKRQLDRLPVYHAFFGRLSDVTVALSEKLVEISPFDAGKVFLTNSGSEANDTVVKMLWLMSRAEGHPERRKIITRVDGYHGVTVATASMTGKSYNAAFGLPLDGFIHADCPHYWRNALPEEDEAAFTQRMAGNLEDIILREGPETIAGFFAEPVMGAGGVIPPSAGYFDAIQPILKRYGIPFVADEVITGFGRTGEVWGATTYDIAPDVIVASKCISAGYFPMGAIILNERFAQRLERASQAFDEFPHGFTSGGHPVGCAVALEAIDLILNGGLLENVRRVSPRFQERLQALGQREEIGEARGIGLMGALEMVGDRAAKTPFPAELAVSERVATTALRHGLICRPIGQAIVLCPPFIVTPSEVDDMFDRLQATLDEVFATLSSA